MNKLAVKYLYFLLGLLATAMGIIGIFLPLMPTTCFLIIAVWAFSKSYPQYSQKILDHPKFGPPIQNWMDHRVINRKVKCTISVSILIGFLITFILITPTITVSFILLSVMTLLLLYINTRAEKNGEASITSINRLELKQE